MQFSMYITGSFTYWFLFRFQAPSGLPSFSCLNGDGEIRTHDPLLARQVLSQLSYSPINKNNVLIIINIDIKLFI